MPPAAALSVAKKSEQIMVQRLGGAPELTCMVVGTIIAIFSQREGIADRILRRTAGISALA